MAGTENSGNAPWNPTVSDNPLTPALPDRELVLPILDFIIAIDACLSISGSSTVTILVSHPENLPSLLAGSLALFLQLIVDVGHNSSDRVKLAFQSATIQDLNFSNVTAEADGSFVVVSVGDLLAGILEAETRLDGSVLTPVARVLHVVAAACARKAASKQRKQASLVPGRNEIRDEDGQKIVPDGNFVDQTGVFKVEKDETAQKEREARLEKEEKEAREEVLKKAGGRRETSAELEERLKETAAQKEEQRQKKRAAQDEEEEQRQKKRARQERWKAGTATEEEKAEKVRECNQRRERTLKSKVERELTLQQEGRSGLAEIARSNGKE